MTTSTPSAVDVNRLVLERIVRQSLWMVSGCLNCQDELEKLINYTLQFLSKLFDKKHLELVCQYCQLCEFVKILEYTST